jgi:hypothetical protein
MKGLHMGGISLGGVVYIILGVLVANSHGYLATIGTLSGLLSAVIAVLLWPLLLFGADLHLVI